MKALSPAPLGSDGQSDVQQVLRAIPRLCAPYELTRAVRSELIRERRRGGAESVVALWPVAAAVQLALLAGLCALYLFSTPPTAVVVSEPDLEARNATNSVPVERSKHSQPNSGPTTR